MKKLITILSLTLCVLLCGTAFAAEFAPMPSIDMENLTDCTFNASFATADVTDKDIFLSVYDSFAYDIADVHELAVGDTITTSLGDIVVEKKDDSTGNVDINGGMEEGGVTLMPVDEDNCYYEMDFEMPAMIVRGQAQLPLAETVKINVYKMAEDLSPNGDGYDTTECAAADAAAALAAVAEKFGEDEFNPYATRVTLENGLVTEVTVDYVP